MYMGVMAEGQDFVEPTIVNHGVSEVWTYTLGRLVGSADIRAFAEEAGGGRHGYATTVGWGTGSKIFPYCVYEGAKGWDVRFKFELNKKFVTVRLDKTGQLDIHLNILRGGKHHGEYDLHRTSLAVGMTLQKVAQGTAPETLKPYRDAICACARRLSMGTCREICFGRATDKTIRLGR